MSKAQTFVYSRSVFAHFVLFTSFGGMTKRSNFRRSKVTFFRRSKALFRLSISWKNCFPQVWSWDRKLKIMLFWLSISLKRWKIFLILKLMIKKTFDLLKCVLLTPSPSFVEVALGLGKQWRFTWLYFV